MAKVTGMMMRLYHAEIISQTLEKNNYHGIKISSANRRTCLKKLIILAKHRTIEYEKKFISAYAYTIIFVCLNTMNTMV